MASESASNVAEQLPRETEADIFADQATIMTSSIAEGTHNKQMCVVDVMHKLRLDNIQPFYVTSRDQDTLDDWMYDLEYQLKQKGIEKSKWALVLRCKVPDLDLSLEGGVRKSFKAMRNYILREYGPDDPWSVILTRIMAYQPAKIKPSKAIGDLLRLQNLATRVAQRVFESKKELPIMLESVIPRLVTVKLEMGIPTITKNQLLAAKTNKRDTKLTDYSKLLGWKSFPYLLEFPNIHQEIIRDYTKVTEDQEPERHVAIRPQPQEEGAEGYFKALNPPPLHYQPPVNAIREKRPADNSSSQFPPKKQQKRDGQRRYAAKQQGNRSSPL